MLTLGGFTALSIGLFAIIGLLRGAWKEFLVTTSVLVALSLLGLVESKWPEVMAWVAHNNQLPQTLLPGKGPLSAQMMTLVKDAKALFWFRTMVFGTLVFFGYQTPRFRLQGGGRFNRMQSAVLGLVFGAVNGFLIIGTVWYFLHAARYFPFHPFLQPPGSCGHIDSLTQHFLGVLPPIYLKGLLLHGLLIVAMALVLVFFV